MRRDYRDKAWLLGFILLTMPMLLKAQDAGEYIRKGNRLYKKGEFSGSEAMFRRAGTQEGSTNDAVFNLGDALYKQGRFSDAATEFDRASAGYEDITGRAESFYNLGNSFLKDKKYKESIGAYINSLRLKPDNMEAKYNLAFAQEQLKKQQEQEQQENKQNGDNSDENQEKNENQQEQQQDQQQDLQQPRENPDQQESTMNREDAKRLLDALSAAEKKTQEKVRQDKARGAKVRVIKNW